jgi:deferrochelatase/peroxidase EfeB
LSIIPSQAISFEKLIPLAKPNFMATPINIDNPLLDNLQANILKGHGRNFAHHLFLRFDKNKVDKVKAWISQFAGSKITSTSKQLKDKAAHHKNKSVDGGTVFTLSLSSAGYDKLGLGAVKPKGESFKNSMSANADQLGDNPATWEDHFHNIDALLIVADEKSAVANAKRIKFLLKFQVL